ncbi:MAG: hypothetical protein GOV15_02785 [Candidatus Diapherotrites archaeon]|nr:hypothetical protein [Candidatus Diapherotrites archaeon]
MHDINHKILLGLIEIDDLDELLSTIRKLANKENVVQTLDSQYVSSTEQLSFADLEARWAFENKRNLTKDLNTEFLLRLSGQRQIKKALEDFGIKKTNSESTSCPVIVYCSGPNAQKNSDTIINELNFIVDETILDVTPQKKKALMKHYSITPKALETIGSLDALVLEKISLIGLEE